MLRWSRFLLLWVQLLLVSEGIARAAEVSEAELSRRLKSSADFRVRTQAALALGATSSATVVEPLCSALEDPNTTVRAAAAAALGRVAKGGRNCIERQIGRETSAEVKTVLQRALTRLAPEEPAIGVSTKYYVALGDPTNQTRRTDAQLFPLVRATLSKHFGGVTSVTLAPEKETPEQAQKRLAKFPKVRGVYVWPKLITSYTGGKLVLKLELSLFTYPGKAFKGSMSKNLTMPDVPSLDTGAEDELLEMAAERMTPDLEKTMARL
jgi:HEAT repeat protein